MKAGKWKIFKPLFDKTERIIMVILGVKGFSETDVKPEIWWDLKK